MWTDKRIDSGMTLADASTDPNYQKVGFPSGDMGSSGNGSGKVPIYNKDGSLQGYADVKTLMDKGGVSDHPILAYVVIAVSGGYIIKTITSSADIAALVSNGYKIVSTKAGEFVLAASTWVASKADQVKNWVSSAVNNILGKTGAKYAPVEYTGPGETFVRVGYEPENLKFTFDNPGGVQPGAYAFPEETFNEIGFDSTKIKDLGDLPGSAPQYYRTLQPPVGTPIQRGIVPGGEFGGTGGIPEVIFPEGF